MKRKINPDGTLKGFEFKKGYNPLEDDTAMADRLIGQDLIDFPCSTAVASYFALKGYTQDYPKEFYDKPSITEKKEVVSKTRVVMNLDKKAMELHNRLYFLEEEFKKYGDTIKKKDTYTIK